MRSFNSAILFLLLGLNLAGCSSTEEKPVNQKAASNRPANAAPSANTANSPSPVNTETAAKTEEQPTADETMRGRRNSKIEAMRKETQNSPPSQIDIEAELRKSTRPAPENSEFAVLLTDVVLERRTFKSHPQLLKVEKVTDREKKTIKVYLKDGRVVEIPGEKIDSISTASSTAILQAAGLGSPADVRKPNSKTKD